MQNEKWKMVRLQKRFAETEGQKQCTDADDLQMAKGWKGITEEKWGGEGGAEMNLRKGVMKQKEIGRVAETICRNHLQKLSGDFAA